MKRKTKFFRFLVVSLLLFSFFINSPMFVSASEEEEIDDFSVMPNYRWQNLSSTSNTFESNENEYHIFSSSNGSDNAVFRKTRQLNSKDMYFESRIGISNDSFNEVEYFRDVLGDPCDFEEDDEGFINEDSVKDGIIEFSKSGTGWFGRTYLNKEISRDLEIECEIKIKSDTITNIRICLLDERTNWIYYSDFSLSKAWTTIRTQVKTLSIGLGNIKYFQLNNLGGDNIHIYIDYIKIFTKFDFVSHVESEIEDTWDWEDSREYFYDELRNISDFNDGSLESAYLYSVGTLTNVDGWANVSYSGSLEKVLNLYINVSGISSAETYKYFGGEFIASGDVYSILFYDNDSNQIASYLPDISANTKELVYVEFDSNWAGSETELRIRVNYVDYSADLWFAFNFTFLYDSELGELEGWSEDHEYSYVDPQGWLTVKFEEGDNYEAVYDLEHTTLNIDTSLFETVKIKMKAPYWDLKFKIRGLKVGESTEVTLSSTFEIYSNDWIEYTVDLSDDSDWRGSFKYIYLLFNDISGDFEGDEYILIDYFLLLGNYSSSGFAFEILKEDQELGMDFRIRNYNSTSFIFNSTLYDILKSPMFTYSKIFDKKDIWLNLKVEINIEKKTSKILLYFDDGNKIIKGNLYDLFGYFGRQIPYLFKMSGFPYLAINNSQEPLQRNEVFIDYIRSNFDVFDWTEPSGALVVGSDSYSQDDTSNFDSISPYSIYVEGKDITSKDHYYGLLITQFDGLSFEYELSQNDLDNGDGFDWYFIINNINCDGTLSQIGYIRLYTRYDSVGNFKATFLMKLGSVELFNDTLQYEDIYVSGRVSIALIDENTVELQATCESKNERFFSGQLKTSEGINSKEFLFYNLYSTTLHWGDNSDDMIVFKISSFEYVRKDIISDIVGGIIKGVGELIMFILSPLIVVVQFLAFVFKFVGDLIVTGITAVLDLLLSVLNDIFEELGKLATEIWSQFSGVLSDILSEITFIAGDIWSNFQGILDNILSSISKVGEYIITELLSKFEDIITDMLDWLIQYYTLITDLQLKLIDWLINQFILVMITDILNNMGLGSLIDLLNMLMNDFIPTVLELIDVAVHFFGWFFWLITTIINNLEPIFLTIFTIFAFWLCYPLLFFFRTPFEDWYTLDGIDAIQEFLMRIKEVLLLSFNLIKEVFTIVMRLFTAVGSWIPLT